MMGFEFGQIQRAFFHVLGLALMLGRLVVLWPFCGLSSRFHRNRHAQVCICRSRTFLDGSCRLGSFIRGLLGWGTLCCGPMRISLGFLNVAHLTTPYMDVTSLLASNMESFLRNKLVVQSLLQCDSGILVCLLRKVARASQVFIKQAW